jgi:hypothetical protein
MSAPMSSVIDLLPVQSDVFGDDEHLDAHLDVYDEIETLLRDDLPRQGCIELAQALEDVMALLMHAASEFSDPQSGRFPMGQGGSAH